MLFVSTQFPCQTRMPVMAKTAPRKLTIVAYPPVSDWPELAELEAKGHTVYRLETDADLVLGPQCWRMREELRKYLEAAVKAARKALT